MIERGIELDEKYLLSKFNHFVVVEKFVFCSTRISCGVIQIKSHSGF